MKIEKRVLENGLRVFLAHIPSARTVCTMFAVRAGWRYERAGVDVGVAHFLEHENFRGTSRRPTSRDISCAIEGVGGRSNAFTEPESICYYNHMPSRHAELGIDILSDMVLNPLLEEETIDVERGSVMEEYRGILANPETLLEGVIFPGLMFGGHPLGWVGTGSEEEINRINRAMMICYMNDLFSGPNSAVVCAGNIEDPDRLFTAIKLGFGALPAYPPRRRKRKYGERQSAANLILREADIEQVPAALGFRGIFRKNRVRLMLLAAVLGGGMSSRLFLNVRDRLGLAYSIGSELAIHSDVVSMSVFAGFDREKWKDGLAAVIEEMRSIREEGISEEELDLAREKLLGEVDFTCENPHRLAATIARRWILYGKVKSFESVVRDIRAVSVHEVLRAAGEVFRASKINCAALGPSPGEEREVRKILASLGGG